MEAIKFNISSEFAIFKNADTRNGRYFSYNHIHRISILGIIGAIIGLEGYNTHQLRKILKKEDGSFYPQFYEKLKEFKVSIVPNSEFDSFNKQIHNFTDTTYFSNADGTLMVYEQWLRKPSWDIYLLLDGVLEREIQEKIKDYLLNQKTNYIPYMGKNDHPVTIKNVQIAQLDRNTDVNVIDSLFEVDLNLENEIKDQEDEIEYYLFEYLPISLDRETGNYKFKKMAYTDAIIDGIETYYDKLNEKNIIFV